MSADQVLDYLTEDFSAEVEAKIPEYVDPVKKDKTKLKEALESLLTLEKKTRLAADQKSTKMLALAIIKLCKDCGEWSELNDHVSLLCKRRAQLKKVVQTIIQEAMKFIDDTPDKKTKIALIEQLRLVSAGKMFVELERARMTRQLAEMKEEDGDVASAADILQEVSVETIGTMEAREKLDFLLEQVRLCLAKKDYIRAEIISKKATEKQINSEELQDLKLKYYRLMIELHMYNDSYLDVCKAYDKMYNTKVVQEDEKQWKPALSKAIMFLALSPFDYEVCEMLERFKLDPKVEQLPMYKQVLTAYTTQELISWPLPSEKEFQEQAEFKGEKKELMAKNLHKRVVQHNIRVLSKYYSRLTSERMAQLLQLDQDKTEEYLSEMVSSKQLTAKMDRCVGTVTFVKKQSPALVLNSWSDDITSLLSLVEKTCHLINNENMVHGVK